MYQWSLHVSQLYAKSFFKGCKAVYLSRTIFILFWYVCMRIIISIEFFTIGNFKKRILFFQCKVSKSRHIVGGHGPVKSLAFVEELWTFKPPARRVDILTSEFNVRRLYRTSPTPTYYVLDVWRIIGESC